MCVAVTAHLGEHVWRNDRCVGCATHRTWPLASQPCPCPVKSAQKKRPGGKAHLAKLTEDQVRALREAYDGGRSIGALAREYNLAWTTARDIARRITYRRVA